MKLSAKNLQYLTEVAIVAARKAGEIIVSHDASRLEVEQKMGGSSLASQVLTEVDLLCQQAILNEILPTCELFDLALLAEESEDDGSRLQKDYFWCIDPLDGTLPFIEKTPGYAVSIALVARSGESQLGVIFDPVKQTLYHAIRCQGAFRNGEAWHVNEPQSTKKPLTFICDRSFLRHELYTQVEAELLKIAEKRGLAGLQKIQFGGAAMNACWVLENSPACYFKFPKTEQGGGSLWDYAASTCIFAEAGGFVSDIFGVYLDLNRPDSTFMNHRGIIYASNKELAEMIMRLHSGLA